MDVSRHNREVVTVYYDVLASLLHDSPLVFTRQRQIERRRLLIRQMKIYTYSELTSKHRTLIGLLMSGERAFQSLKTALGNRYLGTTPFIDEIRQWCSIDEDNPSLFAYLLTCLQLHKKLRIDNPSLADQSLKTWLRTDDDLEPSWFGSARASRLRTIVQSILNRFDDYDPREYKLSHGPGRVADQSGSDLYIKCRNNTAFMPFVRWIVRSFSDEACYDLLEWYGHRVNDITTDKRGDAYDDEGRRIAAYWLDVPKSDVARRAISAEPACLMYHQQNLKSYLYEQLDKHFIESINLKDQSQNQKLALLGSIDGGLSTIDLSSASDTVSYELACHLFSGHVIGDLLLTLRSETTELPNGSVIRTKKYAPMGSALCFPVQCIIFYATCLLSSEEMGGRHLYRKPSVYGDDIIVDSRLHDVTIECLEHFGFIPNVSKSFGGDFLFRESCGGWYYRGVDVTPSMPNLKEPKIPEMGTFSSISVEAWIEAYNSLRARYYKCAARAVLHRLRRSLRGRVLTFARDPITSLELKTDVKPFSNIHTVPKIVRDAHGRLTRGTEPYYHGVYVRALTKRFRHRAVHGDISLFENYRYMLWWEMRGNTPSFILSRLPLALIQYQDVFEPVEIKPTVPKGSTFAYIATREH
jgi:hypothetical protein